MAEAKDIVRVILQQYSCPKYEETRCSTKDIERDFVKVLESVMRSERSTREMHEAFLRLQADKERNKSFWERLFA